MTHVKAPFTERAARLLCAALWLLCVACGDSEPEGEPLDTGGSRRDSGAAAGDAGDDAGADASVDTDAGVQADASAGPSPNSGCSVDPEEFSLPIDDTGLVPFSAGGSGSRHYLAFQQSTCGAVTQALGLLGFGSTGAFEAPRDVVNAGATWCVATGSPALVVRGDGAPVVYYAASNSGSLELYRGLFDPEKPNGSPEMLGHTRLTFDAEGAADSEALITAIPYSDSELVAYVNNQTRFGMSDVGQLVTRLHTGEEYPVVEHDAALYFSDLARGGFGVDGASGGVLAWVAQGAEGGAVQFQRLEAASGQPAGDIVTLTTEVGAAANVDFAVHPRDGARLGALVYTESPGGLSRHEVRFRTVSEDGTLGRVVRITSGDKDARNVAIAPFADGYAIAYRLVTGSNYPYPVMQLSFVNHLGASPRSGGERVLVRVAAAGGHPTLWTSTDGRLMLAFTDRTPEGLALRVLRVDCLGVVSE